MSNNPYEPAPTGHPNADRNQANWRLWAVFGFVIACIPTVAIGAYSLYADVQYAATLPPNTPRCGNGVMAAILLIFPLSPMLGCCGAVIGFISATVCNAATIGGPQEAEDVR